MRYARSDWPENLHRPGSQVTVFISPFTRGFLSSGPKRTILSTLTTCIRLPTRTVYLQRNGDEDASIFAFSIFVMRPISPLIFKSLVKDAPLVVESPPDPVQVDSGAFYY